MSAKIDALLRNRFCPFHSLPIFSSHLTLRRTSETRCFFSSSPQNQHLCVQRQQCVMDCLFIKSSSVCRFPILLHRFWTYGSAKTASNQSIRSLCVFDVAVLFVLKTFYSPSDARNIYSTTASILVFVSTTTSYPIIPYSIYHHFQEDKHEIHSNIN